MIAVTGFDRVSDVRTGARGAVEWSALVSRLSHHDRRSSKDGPGWAPAVFREPCTCGGEKCPGAGGHRIDENVIELHALVFDLDKQKNPRYPGKQADGKPEPSGIPLDEATARACLDRLDALGLRRLVHTTHSHHPPERWSLRVVIALSQPVPADRWERFWRAAVTRIGIHVEPSCFNPARFWYAPSAPADGDAWSRSSDGAPLDVQQILDAAEPAPRRPAPAPRRTPPGRSREEFDVYRFIAATYPGSRPEQLRTGGMRWEIECPWEAEHSSSSPRDTMISADSTGKLGFSCLHDHCAERGWTEFRKFHEPQWVPFADRPAPALPSSPGATDDLSRARARKTMRTDTPRAERQAEILGASPQLDLRHAGLGPEGGYRCTDLGNARRFADMHGSRMKYVHAWGQWISWDGKRWKRDDRGSETQAAGAVTAQIYLDAARCAAAAAVAVNAGGSTGPTAVEGLAKWATDSAKRARLEAMTALARSEREIVATQSEFNRDPWLLNVSNGTINLRDGELSPHRQSDMITMLSDVEYDSCATAPEWEKFLGEVLPDDEVRTWIQRYLGYSLTGLVSEQQFAFWVGKGGNGKNVCIDAVVATLGEYAIVGAPDLLLEKRNEAHPTELADIEGRRLVVCSEIEQGRAWAEGRIKEITGNRTIKARRMGQDFFEFDATSKLVVLANTKPKVKSADNGLWRRMNLVPWSFQVPAERRDKYLLERLIANERPGILAWLVRGCLAWQNHSLGTARAITLATDEYRQSEDVLGLWIAEKCKLHVGHWQTTADLYDGYKAWCKDEGIEKPWTLKAWMARLTEREGITRKSNGVARGLQGIRLLGPGEYS